MNLNETKQMIRILKMHYEQGISQEEIAQIEHMSKSKVNRLIKKSIAEGYITININYPMQSVQEIEDELKQTFGLKKVFVSPVFVDDEKLVKADVSKALGLDLEKIVNDNDIIGVSWGTTMNAIASCMPRMMKSGIKVVQLNGGVSKNVKQTYAMDIVEQFSENFNGIGYVLPMPTIVDNNIIADVLKKDSQISKVFKLMHACRIAIFSIGRVSDESVLCSAGYFTTDEYEQLRSVGTVGDICSRFFDVNGKIVDPVLDGRTIAIPLQELKKKEYSIGIAVGKEKARAVLGALNGGYINTLYTDENMAKEIMRIHNGGHSSIKL